MRSKLRRILDAFLIELLSKIANYVFSSTFISLFWWYQIFESLLFLSSSNRLFNMLCQCGNNNNNIFLLAINAIEFWIFINYLWYTPQYSTLHGYFCVSGRTFQAILHISVQHISIIHYLFFAILPVRPH